MTVGPPAEDMDYNRVQNYEGLVDDGAEALDGGSDEEDKKKDEEVKEEKPKQKKRVGPRCLLTADRLTGPRGIPSMEDCFAGVKLSGQRNSEKKDLDAIMKALELWTHRLYPRGHFDDSLKKIERLGKQRSVSNCVKRVRLGMEGGSGSRDVIRDKEPDSPPPNVPQEDPFDLLVSSTGVSSTGVGAAPQSVPEARSEDMTAKQREAMLRNRLIAEEIRAARIKRAQELKERFKSQQSSNCESVNRGVQIKQSQTQENGVGDAQMEHDDNHGSTRAYFSNGHKINEDVARVGAEKLNQNEIRQEGAISQLKAGDDLSNEEMSVEHVEEVASSQEKHENVSAGDVIENSITKEDENRIKDFSEEEMITDHVEQVASSQEKHEYVSAGDVIENNITKEKEIESKICQRKK